MSKGRFFLLRGQLYVLEYPKGTDDVIERLPTEEEAEAAIDSLMEAVRDGRFNPGAGVTLTTGKAGVTWSERIEHGKGWWWRKRWAKSRLSRLADSE